MKSFTKYLPIVSNIAYPIAGLFGDWLTLVAGFVLAIGSGWMHYEQEIKGRRSRVSIYADWLSMYFFFLAILSYHTNLYVIFTMAALIPAWEKIKRFEMIGLVVILTILISQAFWAFAVFIPAVLLRNEFENTKWQDYSHSAWHLLTAFGSYLIIVTGV